MAKQTFSTGQVLTAAQMTSLQQTAMLGGAASAKTASYTLVAADAGTAISMSNASATTITVNTALFAAGDTVHITNLGVGVCTITAGTATVNSSASLALAQYESGFLDFTSASAAIFVKGAGAAASAGGADWSLLNSGGTALTGAATITISGISGKDKIMAIVTSASAGAASEIDFRLNADTGNNYSGVGVMAVGAFSYGTNNIRQYSNTGISVANFARQANEGVDTFAGGITFTGCNSSGIKAFQVTGGATGATGGNQINYIGQGLWNNSATVTSISILSSVGNFDAGTIYVYTSA